MLKIRICILRVAGRLGRAGVRPVTSRSALFALRRTPFAFRSVPLILFAGFLALPVLAVLASWLPFGQEGGGAQAGAILREMAATVLPGYVGTTLWLSVLVALGAAVVGTGAAAAVTLFDFPGRRTFEWLLLLPLAMPAYVTAYAYTDFLQFSGPLQVGLRNTFGLEGRLLPEVRSLGGAVWVFIFSLYPYVYLLARTALGERAAHLMEAARLLGAPLSRRIRAVALPLARPTLAALCIILFLTSWNNYLWPLLIAGDKAMFTAPVALGSLIGISNVSWGGIMAGAVLLTAPMLAVFLLLQRHFIAGIAAGAVK